METFKEEDLKKEWRYQKIKKWLKILVANFLIL